MYTGVDICFGKLCLNHVMNNDASNFVVNINRLVIFKQTVKSGRSILILQHSLSSRFVRPVT